MIVHTCPGAMNPCTRLLDEASRARIAGGTRTCEASMEKFVNLSRLAWYTAIALAGAVVSNPTARNTTFLSGLHRAIFNASTGEYAIRTSAPCALARNKSEEDPGTRSMSP